MLCHTGRVMPHPLCFGVVGCMSPIGRGGRASEVGEVDTEMPLGLVD